MERVVFTNSWEQILAEKGLKSFDDFYRCGGKKTIGKNRNRNVSVIRLKIADEEKIFYLKRFHHSHLKDMLFTFLNTGKLCTQAAYEWRNIRTLAGNNIGAPRRVCFGEQLRLGLERKSFIVTEELKEQCLTDFIAQNWEKLPAPEREKIIISLGQTIRKIHKAGISMPDLYVWHIFISKNENDEYNFSFIDLNRMKQGVAGKNEKIKNLGRLHYSMIDKYFDKPMRRLLIESYAGKSDSGEFDKLIRRVKKYSAKRKKKKKIKQY